MPDHEPTTIFLDTTIPNYLLADRGAATKATKELIDLIKNNEYQAYISDVVIEEIENTPDETHRSRLARALDSFPSVLIERTEIAERLAEEYLNRKIIPSKYENDALQIAIPTTNLIRYIVTWNFAHMANVKTVDAVNKTNAELGYPQIHIVAPYELTGHSPGQD